MLVQNLYKILAQNLTNILVQNLNGFGWLFMFNATFATFQLCNNNMFYLWMKPIYTEKTTDLSQVVSSTPSHRRDSNS